MKRFVLVEVVERDISTPDFFDSEDAAAEEMLKRFAEVLKISIEDAKETRDNGDGYVDDGYIGLTCAYCENKNHDNCDWSIFSVEVQ